jgi:hypothetical protein
MDKDMKTTHLDTVNGAVVTLNERGQKKNWFKCNEFNGGSYYYDEDGNYHRKDGPAIIYPSGKSYCYVNGHNVSKWFEDRGLNIEDMSDDDWAIFELEMKFVFKGK